MDDLYELNKEFVENERDREDCGMANCHAPKVDEMATEAGLPIAVCAYHRLVFAGEMKEEFAQRWYEKSFEEVKKDWEEYNEKIRGENIGGGQDE